VLRAILLALLSLLVLAGFNIAEVRAPNGLHVHNLNTGLNYTTIQQAINAPETLNGHTILVDEGIYYEHVVISKSVSLIGKNKTETIIDGTGLAVGTNAVDVYAPSVTISGFTIQNSQWVAINLENSYCTVNGNILRNCDDAVGQNNNNNNTISENTFENNTGRCIFLWRTYWNVAVNNVISRSWEGIIVEGGGNLIGNNSIMQCTDIAINTVGGVGGENNIIGNLVMNNSNGIGCTSGGCNVTANTVMHNGGGISLLNAYGSIVSGNVVSDNTGFGITTDASAPLTFRQNNITKNKYNLYLGEFPSDYERINIDISNEIDGKPVY